MSPFKPFNPFSPFRYGGGKSLESQVRALYANGEQGPWWDIWDIPTLYQDMALTTPVTAMEQYVAVVLDKSGNGHHLIQPTLTKRMRVSRRVNLLTGTDNPATWGYQGSRFTAGPVDAHGAALFTADIQNTVMAAVTTDYPIGASYTQSACIVRSIEVKAGSATHFWFGSAGNFVIVRLSDGVVEFSNELTTYTVTPAGDGYWRIDLYLEYSGGSWGATRLSNYASWGMGRNGSEISTTDQIGSTVYMRRPIFVVESFGYRLPVTYQRVTTATDYDDDPSKFPTYLQGDGIDDCYVTNEIDLTGTDKINVWAGITKLSDAAAGVVLELGPNISTADGCFNLTAPYEPAAQGFGFRSRGTVLPLSATVGSLPSPSSQILSGIGDISGDISRLYVYGGATGQIIGDQGTGNYGKYPLFIGARNKTSLFFNGKIYSLLVRGALSNASQHAAVNQYIKQRMMLP